MKGRFFMDYRTSDELIKEEIERKIAIYHENALRMPYVKVLYAGKVYSINRILAQALYQKGIVHFVCDFPCFDLTDDIKRFIWRSPYMALKRPI